MVDVQIRKWKYRRKENKNMRRIMIKSQVSILFLFFWFGIHTACMPSTTETCTGVLKSRSAQPRVDEGMGANQLCRIVVGISSQIGRDGHRDMGDVSTYGIFFRNLLGSMKPPGSNLCADTRRCKYLRASQSLSENGKRPALSRKRSDILNIWQ